VKLPAAFISHGAPTIALEEQGGFARALRAFGASVPRPRAVAAVSAHWTVPDGSAVTVSPRPPTVHDFGGFPEALYRIRYPAPGAPDVASAAARLLDAAGFPTALDPERGLDHGAWVPLRFVFPDADVPVFQIALPDGEEPEALYRFGAALAPLREDGVLLVGTGGVVHNLSRVRFDGGGPPEPWASAFDAWAAERLARLDREGLARWREAPHARLAAPTPEHLDPLLVVVGAASADETVSTIYEGFTYGNLSMRSIRIGPRASNA
jgi:4,5-DOPA dioxygenase extradiol